MIVNVFGTGKKGAAAMKVIPVLLVIALPVVALGCQRKNDDSNLTDEQLLRKVSSVIVKNPGEGELLYAKYEERQRKKNPEVYARQRDLIFKAAQSDSKEKKVFNYRKALDLNPKDNGVKFSLAMSLKNGNDKDKDEAISLFGQIVDSKDGVYDMPAKKMKEKM